MHKILIVDDEKPARDFIAELVAFYIPDSVVEQAGNPFQALECMKRKDFDLLFVDIHMPGMTGLELLEKINQTEKASFKVIVSAHCEFDYAVKGMEFGAVRYITKPLYKEKIYDIIKLYLSRKKPDIIDLKVPDGIRRIEINRLIALETIDRRKLKVYTTDTCFPDVTGSLSQLQSLLPQYFRYIRRDCILNYHAVKQFNPKSREVIISSQKKEIAFIISRDKIKEIAAWFDADSENIKEDEK